MWGELAWQLGGRDGYDRVARRRRDRAPTPAPLSCATCSPRYAPCLDPDRRVGRLRPPALEPRRPARRHLRHAHHLRPGADRGGQVGAERAARRLDPRLRRRCATIGDRSTATRSAASAASRRWSGCASVVHRTDAVAAGDRRRELRDRPPPPVQADRPPTTSPQRDVTCRRVRRAVRQARRRVPGRGARARLRASGIKAAYPIHPELFDRLYEDWSTLERFQRTRGVLRLMAHRHPRAVDAATTSAR